MCRRACNSLVLVTLTKCARTCASDWHHPVRWATLSGDDYRDGIAPHTDW